MFDELDYLAGSDEAPPFSLKIFDNDVRNFLSDLSSTLLKDKSAKTFPDLQTFAFWCRPSHFDEMHKAYNIGTRVGRGLVFHITPSNVPIISAYTYALGLIAGNSNIVRVSSRNAPQITVLISILNHLFQKPVHDRIKRMTSIVKYQHNTEITSYFSNKCDARVIWGGDSTVREIRSIPIKESSVEIAFADRYSFCVLDAMSILNANDESIDRLVQGFYNDTFLMDQNACSSPHLIIWIGEDTLSARQRFWGRLGHYAAEHYDLKPIQAVEKLTLLLESAITGRTGQVCRYGNNLYTIEIEDITNAHERLRGRFGLFYEKTLPDLQTFTPHITRDYQTMTYFGLSPSIVQSFVMGNQLKGIDRIVPVGQALDMGPIWDGNDIIATLSRIVDIA
jgi:hypothetical protein